MKNLAALFVLLQMLILPGSLSAQDHMEQYAGTRVVSTTSWIEEWDPITERWVRVADTETQDIQATTTITKHIVNGVVISEAVEQTPAYGAARYSRPLRSPSRAQTIAQYGPFRVIDGKRAALLGTTGPNSPEQFDAMMRDFPGLEVLELVDAGGTSHDLANLAVGRRIRAAGLRTHVPNGGSARSGGVELFLAGANRTMAPGAQFAVHSWLDNYGREPDDFAPDAPENRLYLDYYVEMGMSETRARDFYAMTNSVPHSGALWLRATDMSSWIAPERDQPPAPIIAVQPEVRFAADDPLPMPALALEPVQLVMLTGIELAPAPMINYSDLTRLAYGKIEISMAGAS